MNKVSCFWSDSSVVKGECYLCGVIAEVGVDWSDGWIFSVLSGCNHLSSIVVEETFPLGDCSRGRETTFYLVFSTNTI